MPGQEHPAISQCEGLGLSHSFFSIGSRTVLLVLSYRTGFHFQYPRQGFDFFIGII